MKRYSVLLLYPDYVADTYGETYYQWVEATSPADAVEAARFECREDNVSEFDPKDLAPLLVTEGHHYGLDSERNTP